MQINDWPIFGCKVGQSVHIGMKLKLDTWHHLLDVYTKFQTDISKHVQKKSGKLFAGWELYWRPFQVFFVHQRVKNYPTMTKISRDQDTQYKCVPDLSILYDF